MVEAVGGGVGAGCAGAGVVVVVVVFRGCKVARLQGCKYKDKQRVSFYLFCWGLMLV